MEEAALRRQQEEMAYQESMMEETEEAPISFRYLDDMPGKPAEVIFYNQDGSRQKRHWLTYDASGNIVKAVEEENGRFSQELFGAAGLRLRYSSPTYSRESSYEFDVAGNWIKETENIEDYGNSVKERQITYY